MKFFGFLTKTFIPMISHSFFHTVPRNKTQGWVTNIAWWGIWVELTAAPDYTRGWGKPYSLHTPNENYSAFDHQIQANSKVWEQQQKEI